MVDKGIPIRLVLYSVAILYLAVDFFVIRGPLQRAVFRRLPKSPEVIEAAKKEGVVARVFLQPIVIGQVDRRVEEDLWRTGRRIEEIEPEEQLRLRKAALDTLIDLHLLRLKVRFNQKLVQVTEEEIEAELAVFRSRFGSEQEVVALLEGRGWSAKELRYRLAARIQQEKYLAKLIEVEVSEEEARIWFEENKEELALPARVRVRHIFVSTLERKPEDAREILAGALQKLQSGEATFVELAAALSEDERSKERGGELGWMQAGRLREDFAKPVFAMKAGERQLVRTGIGWHLVEVLERKPARERNFAEARDDVRAALEAVKRTEGLKRYRAELRGRDRHKVEIFEDVLERGLDLPE